MAEFSSPHRTVLLDETLKWLDPRPGQRFVDMTLGGGGLTRALLEAVGPEGFVLGIDRDKESLNETCQRLRDAGYGEDRFEACWGSFADIDALLGDKGILGYDGFACDFGACSLHFDRAERGFSFRRAAPLDMRFDRSGGKTLAEVLEELDEATLGRVLRESGEERFAARVAKAIVEAREAARLTDTLVLADTIRGAYPAPARRNARKDPATKAFQALRILVNDELGHIRAGLVKTIDGMKVGARLAAITFHSLEDRIVKRLFRAVSEGPKDFYGHRAPAGARELFRKPVAPSAEERESNARARSAKLRVLLKEKEGRIVPSDLRI